MFLLSNFTLAFVYFLGAVTSQYFSIPPGNVCPFWIPAGFIFTAVYLYGFRFLPGIFLGAFIGNTWAYFDFQNFSNLSSSLISGSMNGLGDTVGIFLSVLILKKLKKNTSLTIGTNLFLFLIVGGIFNALISASFGVPGLLAGGFIDSSDFLEVFVTWWLGDAAGIIYITPLLLAAMEIKSWPKISYIKTLEVCLFSFITLLALKSLVIDLNLTVLTTLPLLLWSVYRFKKVITLSALLVITLIVAYFTNKNIGPFAGMDSNEALIHMLSVFTFLYITVQFLISTEEQRTETADALEQSEKFNRLLMEEIPMGLALCDMEGKLLYINKEFSTTLGRTKEETLNLTYWEITPVKYSKEEEIQLSSLHKNGYYGPYEKEYIHKSGDLIPVRLRGTIINIEGKSFIWSSVENISKEKENNLLLQKTLEKADHANNAKNDFLSAMSHELRTPLNAILGFTEVLNDNLDDSNSQQLKQLNQIKEAGNHLLVLINEVLNLSQIESGKLTINKTSINLNKVVNECLDISLETSKKKNIDITYLQSNRDYFVLVDPIRLKQILLNLISNAIKYNKTEGKVELSCELKRGDKLVFKVKDSGIGIPAEKFDDIFNPFERHIENLNEIEGTGIGLTLCKKLAELMGARLEFKSELGVGSTFWIELDICDAPILSESIPLSNMRNSQSLPLKKKVKILYVEDNLANLTMFESYFENYKDSYEVKLTSKPEEAISIAEYFLPDIILMDLKMPKISGIDLMKELRVNDKLSHIPVIALSANALQKDIVSALEVGFSDYITKPYTFKNLVQKIDDRVLNEQ